MLHLVQPIEPVIEWSARTAASCRWPWPPAPRAICERILHQIGMRDGSTRSSAPRTSSGTSPSPDVFLEAARRLGVEPRYCLVYEDTDPGLEAARRAGMDTSTCGSFIRRAA